MKTALYIHIPFCQSKCHYCDFYSAPSANQMEWEEYTKALGREIQGWQNKRDDLEIDTVYVGGGTPSLLPPSLWEILFSSLKPWLRRGVAEFTVEANPESLRKEHLKIWGQEGVTRLSLGIQTASEQVRRLLGRGTRQEDILRSREALSRWWRGDLSLDWMIGLPRERTGGRAEDRVDTGEILLTFAPHHISCYELMVEEGTPLKVKIDQRRLSLPEEDDVAGEAQRVFTFLHNHGYQQYEISNFAFPGKESRHNLHYWHWEPYLGIGRGAHSLLNRGSAGRDSITWEHRAVDRQDIRRYSLLEELSWAEGAKEFLMMGCRLTAGVSGRTFRRRFGLSPGDVLPRWIEFLKANDYIEKGWQADPGGIPVNRRGRDMLNLILPRAFDEIDRFWEAQGGKQGLMKILPP